MMASFGQLVGLVLVFHGILAVSANDEAEMNQVIYEETLETGLYPGNVFRTKVYLYPGIKWFRVNLQDTPGNPVLNHTEVAISIRVNINPMYSSIGTIERNWLDASGVSQLDPPEKAIYGEFPFYADYVFEFTLLCSLSHYEVQVNGYDKFTFLHRATTGTLPQFDVVRIMASPGTVDLCWTKFNLDLLPAPTSSSEVTTKCSQPVQRSLCDDLVCYLFSKEHSMYTSTANPVTMTASPMTLSDDVYTSLEEMAEQFCCLEGLIKNIDDRKNKDILQLAAEINTQLFAWDGNASWSHVNEISPSGPLSLTDRLDDIAQVLGNRLQLGKTIEAETPTISCSLESNTLGAFIQKDWTFKPFGEEEDMITIKGVDLTEVGFNDSEIKFSLFGAAYTNITDLINYNQEGTEEFIVADVISATVFGPEGQLVVPVTFSRRLGPITEHNSSESRAPVCVFWNVHLEGHVAGGWSTWGCSRITEDGNPYAEAFEGDYVTCYCNHTTNYAILMRIVPLENKPAKPTDTVSNVSNKILDVLTIIGCIISIMALLMALAFFIFFKHNTLDTERILIHRNLMGALLVAMVTFMIGLYLTNELIPCKIVAVLQHYLYLAVFCWMLVEGIHLYRLIVTVYGSEKQMAKVYYCIGWVLPMVIVAISAGVKWTDYGVPDQVCWLNPVNGLIWAFVGPACAIMLVNFVVLALVIKTTVMASKVCSQDSLTKVKTGLRSSLVLLPMLGITWTIGVITHIHTIFEYIFVIMNSFQGLWLVIVCCLLNGEVRHAFHLSIKKQLGKYTGTVDVTSSTSNTDKKSSSTAHGRITKGKGSSLTDVD
ncbi:adhesion G protein-coupled receptor E3-like isoform X2 [Patiria miniata]|uniref:Adhesion G-protein coupled receptor D1-like n=1 Tax=Patiria miniata TaxID=46514 RepID=A0A913Z3I2_PATMI|nr:adhesion G protein-coupled receptor E3-like isoform X2 [Patiria miniata]